MTKKIKRPLQQLSAFLLIVTMITPYTAFAAEADRLHESAEPYESVEPYEPAWLNQSLIEPYSFEPAMTADFDQPPPEDPPINISAARTERNELSELPPEAIEELLRVHTLTYGSCEGEREELIRLLSGRVIYSVLTDDQRSLLKRRLDIRYEAYDITGQLFAIMERDGFTLAESIELIMIMSGGLFDYIEARTIRENIPSTPERMSELARFEQFAQKFDIVVGKELPATSIPRHGKPA